MKIGECPPGRGGGGWAWIHTSFHRLTEIGGIFHNKYILNNKKKLSKLKSGKCWTRLAFCLISTTIWKLTLMNNPPICKAEENGTGQYSETQKRGF